MAAPKKQGTGSLSSVGGRVTGQGRGGSKAPKGRGGLVPFAGGKGTVKRGGQAL